MKKIATPLKSFLLLNLILLWLIAFCSCLNADSAPESKTSQQGSSVIGNNFRNSSFKRTFINNGRNNSSLSQPSDITTMIDDEDSISPAKTINNLPDITEEGYYPPSSPSNLEDRVWSIELPLPIYSSPVMADIDWDGECEMIVESGPDLYVFRSDGERYWDAHIGTGVFSEIAVGEVDGGFGQDIVFTTNYGVYIFDYEGNRINEIQLGSEQGPTPTLADIDGDGIDEILIAQVYLGYPPNIAYLNALNFDGSQVDGWPITFDDIPYQGFIYPAAVADINNDGFLEVLVTVAHNGGKVLYALNNNGEELWSRQSPYFGAPVLTDLVDNDGFLEVIIADIMPYSPVTTKIYAFDYQGNDVDGWPVEISPYQGPGYDPVIADVDGGFKKEIVVSCTGHIRIYNDSGQLIRIHQDIGGYLTLANIDDDNGLELIGRGDYALKAIDYEAGETVLSFPVEEGYQIYGSAAIGQADNDDNIEIIFCASNTFLRRGIIYCLDKSWSGSSVNSPWPNFRCNLSNAGYYKGIGLTGPDPEDIICIIRGEEENQN